MSNTSTGIAPRDRPASHEANASAADPPPAPVPTPVPTSRPPNADPAPTVCRATPEPAPSTALAVAEANATQAHAPSRWPGRSAAARRFGVDERTIRRWEQAGKLHGVQDADGVYRFHPDELADLEAERAAHGEQPEAAAAGPLVAGVATSAVEQAARAFDHFNRGVDPRVVVVILKLAPTVVQQLFAFWVGMGRQPVLSAAHWAEIERICEGTLTPDQLVTVLSRAVDMAKRYMALVAAGVIDEGA